MDIQVLGRGDAFTTNYFNTSFLVQSGRPFLVDTPQALFRVLERYRIPITEVNDVILTHLHGDHCAGLETLLLWKKHFEVRKIRLHTTEVIFKDFKDYYFPRFSRSFSRDMKEIVSNPVEDYLEFHPLSETKRNELDPGLELSIRYNWHPLPTLGLKFISPLGMVGISGDTCFRPSLLDELLEEGILSRDRYERLAGDWLWEADVIYHETDRTPGTSHTLEADLLNLPAEIRTKIRLIHLPDAFQEERLPVAREGERLRFGAPGEFQIIPSIQK